MEVEAKYGTLRLRAERNAEIVELIRMEQTHKVELRVTDDYVEAILPLTTKVAVLVPKRSHHAKAINGHIKGHIGAKPATKHARSYSGTLSSEAQKARLQAHTARLDDNQAAAHLTNMGFPTTHGAFAQWRLKNHLKPHGVRPVSTPPRLLKAVTKKETKALVTLIKKADKMDADKAKPMKCDKGIATCPLNRGGKRHYHKEGRKTTPADLRRSSLLGLRDRDLPKAKPSAKGSPASTNGKSPLLPVAVASKA